MTPARPRGGRPRVKQPQRHSRVFNSNLTSARREEIKSSTRARTEANTAATRRKKREESAARKLEEAEASALAEMTRKREKAEKLLAKITAAEEDGGEGFSSLMDLFETITAPGGDAQASANVTRFLKSHGKQIVDTVFDRVPAIGQQCFDERFDKQLERVLQKEGKAIQELLTREQGTSVLELLEEFSMEQLGDELQEVAPTLETSEEAGQFVFTTACAMLSISRSQLANNYQVVIGLFLLASGASKREMEVLAHAGLSTSYNTIRNHIKTLSAEGVARFEQLIKTQMCFIVWDNLNIAFRVESQRLKSGNHFDNGTTSTVIPVYNPFTGGSTPLGTLPLSMKPPRTTTLPVLDWDINNVLPSPESVEQLGQCCLWQLKRIALENIKSLEHLHKAFKEFPEPEVDPIAVHKTEQFPLPAMHEDESSLEGTIRVYVQILRNLGVTDDDLRVHGLMFNDGDLLTDSLVDKVESARRNSDGPIDGMKAPIRRFGLFHAKMAGCRLVINEHWGQPNSLWPGSLWWEHTQLLKRKPISAGWKTKRRRRGSPATSSFKFLPDLDTWAAAATIDDFNTVAEQVYRKLFTTHAVDELRSLPHRDISHENVVLLNRDALFYIEFVAAIKKGDIGRVINVLQIWMVMMRSPKTMPKYADTIFETLRRIDRYDPVLKRYFLHNWLVNLTGRPYSFKEVDLLQEHQNFWAKIIYNAKGSNKSWSWLSMITVCIFTLRDTMRTVQKTFNITGYGERHTVPDMTNEVQALAEALQDERLQEHVMNRPANNPENTTAVVPVRDLLEEGAKYADTRGAFKKFTREKRKAENLGVVDVVVNEPAGDMDDESESGMDEDYQVTGDDLGIDDEEPYADAPALLAVAQQIVSDYA
ncbi:hypothetical protein DFH07DRAFT_865154 [Mycena maculata]|uniref:DUF6589 domain-containing protein n=1 Tax=Mycena maculata TaxID=230809 RepID=A0AAD7K8Q3_9AGAR|nr:hypothetical protein DFH07DRAFT_865154 [Mycena maculata]